MASGGVHQGVVAVLESIPYSGIEDIIESWRRSGQKAFILLLDCVQDPQNLGALIRTACCAGCHGVVLPRDRSASLTPSAIKASAGAPAHIPVARVTNLAATLDSLRREAIWIIGAAPDAAVDIFKANLNIDIALVMGGEEKGLRPIIRKKCDEMVRIPTLGAVSSLNVSVAAGIFLFEILRQRLTGAVST